jgi:hypothetical protein
LLAAAHLAKAQESLVVVVQAACDAQLQQRVAAVH